MAKSQGFKENSEGGWAAFEVYKQRRCKGIKTSTRDQCSQWAEVGKQYCRYHGGRKSYSNVFRGLWDKMPSLYSKHLGPALAEKVSEMLAVPVGEQLNLFDELALSRGLLCQALDVQKRYEIAEAGGKDVTPGAKAQLQQMVREALEGVSEMVDKIIKHEKQMEGQISITQLGFFVAQLTAIIFQVMEGHEDLARELVDAIQKNLRLPNNPQEIMPNGISRTTGIVIRADMGQLPASAGG